MTPIPGINVGSAIAPYDSLDNQASHRDIYGEGGLRTVADNTARNAIYSARCKVGMVVFSEAVNTYYKLKSGYTPGFLTDSDWEEFGGSLLVSILQDADGDTSINVEASADEDKIRFTVAGFEAAIMDNSGTDVFLVNNNDTTGLATGVLKFSYTAEVENNSSDDSFSGRLGYKVNITNNFTSELILNGSFEDWDMQDKANDWQGEYATPDLAGKTTDSYTGTYAAWLKVGIELQPGFVITPVIWNDGSNFGNGQTVQLRLYAKYAIGTPTVVVLYSYIDALDDTYYYHFTGPDAGNWIIESGGPVPESMEVITISGAYTQYTSTLATAPSSGVVSGSITIAGSGVLGDEIRIDDVECLIDGVDGALNGDFELWSQEEYKPTSWDLGSINQYTDPLVSSSNAYNGVKAVELGSRYDNAAQYLGQAITGGGSGFLSAYCVAKDGVDGYSYVRMAVLDGPPDTATEQFDKDTSTWVAYTGGFPTYYAEKYTTDIYAEIINMEVSVPSSGIRYVMIWQDPTTSPDHIKAVVDYVVFESDDAPLIGGYLITGDQASTSYSSLNQDLKLEALTIDFTGSTETNGNNVYIRAGAAISQGGVVNGGDVTIETGAGAGGGVAGKIKIYGELMFYGGSVTIDEFSDDETLADLSHTALVTEYAVKNYVDGAIGSYVGHRISDSDSDTWIDVESSPDVDTIWMNFSENGFIKVTYGPLAATSVMNISIDDKNSLYFTSFSSGVTDSSGFVLGMAYSLSGATDALALAVIDNIHVSSNRLFTVDGLGQVGFGDWGQITTDENRDVLIKSHSNDQAGAIAFGIGIEADMSSAGSYVFAIFDNYVSSPEAKFMIDYKGSVLLVDGSTPEPSLAFMNEETSGFSYEVNSEKIYYSIVGTSRFEISPTGIHTGMLNSKSGPAMIQGSFVDSSTAIGLSIGMQVPVTTAGAKVAAFYSTPILGIGRLKYVGADKLQDLFLSGTFNGVHPTEFVIEIDGEGTGLGGVDTFRWSNNGGSSWNYEDVDITGSAQELVNGVYVRFKDTTGHTLGDKEEWDVAPIANVSSITIAGGYLGGVAASTTDFPYAHSIISESNTGATSSTLEIGLAVEVSANASRPGVGIYSVGSATSDYGATGITAVGMTSNSINTTTIYGLQALAAVTNAGDNIAGYFLASGGAKNYAIQTSGATKLSGVFSFVPSTTQSLSAGSTLTVTRGIMEVVGNGGAVTLTSTPTIAAPVDDGTIVVIQGTHNTNTVTFQDNANLSGSNLYMGGTDVTLGANDILVLVYNEDKWIKVSHSNN